MLSTLLTRLAAITFFATAFANAGHFLHPQGIDGLSYLPGTSMNITWSAENRFSSLFLHFDNRRVLLTALSSQTWFEWPISAQRSSAGPYTLQIVSTDYLHEDDNGDIASETFTSVSFNLITSKARPNKHQTIPQPDQIRLPSRLYPRVPRTNATTTTSTPTGTFITTPPTSTSSPTTTAASTALSANSTREDSDNPLHTTPQIYYAIGVGVGFTLLGLIAAITGIYYWLRARRRAQQTRHIAIPEHDDTTEAPGAALSQWWMTNKLGTYNTPNVQRRHYGTGDFEHWAPQRVTGGTRQMKEDWAADWGVGVNEKLLAVQGRIGGGGGWERLDGENGEK